MAVLILSYIACAGPDTPGKARSHLLDTFCYPYRAKAVGSWFAVITIAACPRTQSLGASRLLSLCVVCTTHVIDLLPNVV